MITIREQLCVERVGKGQYTAFLDAELCYQTVAHGGTLISLVQLAIQDAFKHDFTRANQTHLLDLHSSMLRTSLAGDVEIRISEAKIGPITSTVHFNVIQNSKVNITGFATHCNFKVPHPTLLSFPYTNPPMFQPTKHPDFSLLEINMDPNWTRIDYESEPNLPIKSKPQYNWFLASPGLLAPELPSNPPAYPPFCEHWVSIKDQTDKFRTSDLGFLVDTVQRPVESIKPGAENSQFTTKALTDRGLTQRRGLGDQMSPLHTDAIAYPTLSLSLDVRQPLPEEGVRWLYVRATLRSYQGGKWDMEIVVCDEEMKVIAESRLLSLAMDLRVAGKFALKRQQAEQQKKERGQKL